MDINNPLQSLLAEIAGLKAANTELIKWATAMGSIQFLIFRLLMQYDDKLAAVFAEAISRELGKAPPPGWQGAQHDREYMEELLKIALNPTTQQNNVQKPFELHLIKD